MTTRSEYRRALHQQGAALRSARDATDHAKQVLKHTVRAAAADGMPETEIATVAGVTRMTVRAWLGKS